MNMLIDHARRIAVPLSESLAELEVHSTAIAPETARRAIHDVWLLVIEDFEHGRANLSSAYLAKTHAKLAAASGVADSVGFKDQGALPILPDGTAESWSRFAQECGYDSDDGADSLEEEYALAQLRWGQHVRTFALTLGWCAMNIVRMRRAQDAVYPPRDDHERLLRFLEYAGPDTYDAEGGLRGIAGDYAEQQARDNGGSGIA